MSSLRHTAVRILTHCERTTRRLRRRLLAPTRGAQHDRPNGPEEWRALYDSPVIAVTTLASPVARALAQLSQPGDVMLETGCGGATISAELAVADRIIQLADFSQPILDRAARLFEASGLSAPLTKLTDLKKPLPWADSAVDITWSSGVLEHWQDEELVPIVREMARVSRKRVVSFVPFAGSVFYRWGKWIAEENGSWPYGRELPRQSLRGVFEQAGFQNIVERTLWPDAAVDFVHMIDPEFLPDVRRWWHSVAQDDPLRELQGYLLVTIGELDQ